MPEADSQNLVHHEEIVAEAIAAHAFREDAERRVSTSHYEAVLYEYLRERDR